MTVLSWHHRAQACVVRRRLPQAAPSGAERAVAPVTGSSSIHFRRPPHPSAARIDRCGLCGMPSRRRHAAAGRRIALGDRRGARAGWPDRRRGLRPADSRSCCSADDMQYRGDVVALIDMKQRHRVVRRICFIFTMQLDSFVDLRNTAVVNMRYFASNCVVGA